MNNGLRISESEIKLYVENIKSDKNDLDSIIVRKYSIERFEFDLKEEEKTTEVVEIIDEFYLRVYAKEDLFTAEPASRTFELSDLESILDLKLIKKDLVDTIILSANDESEQSAINRWIDLKHKWTAVSDKDDFKLQHIKRPFFYISELSKYDSGTTKKGSGLDFWFSEYRLIEGIYSYDPFTGYYELDDDYLFDTIDYFFFDGLIQFSLEKLEEVFELTEFEEYIKSQRVYSEFLDDMTGDVLSKEQSLLAWKKLKDSFTELSSRDQVDFIEKI